MKLSVLYCRNEKYQQTVAYIGALQWILDYYYRGVQSWSYFYPYHYAPFVSDLRNVKDYVINFNIGKPYLPFQQVRIITSWHLYCTLNFN